MKHADACVRRELGELQRFAFSRVQKTTNTLHELDLRIQNACAFRLATQARAKACLFGGFRQVEELDALAMCAT